METDSQSCTPPPSTAAGSSGKRGRKRNDSKKSLAEIALGFIRREGPKASCAIDAGSACQYSQDKLDVGNFIRHFRTRHLDFATANGLFKEKEVPAKKKRVVPKRPVAIDAPLIKDSLLKMVTYHNLPRRFVQWEGFKQLFDPLGAACGMTINEVNMMHDLTEFAQKLRTNIAEEMRGRLVSLKIDSAAYQNRHILGVNAQYAMNDNVVIRTLGKYAYA
ncbi:uncharacterized protein LOC134287512 [Aedes albopictus]|uniref:Uncharacterized protein n=1 Tax=Aedes albopictus TaxID=7160 RepID=A0ABM1ZPQ2_AEDAL|nr:uncharacterized protein LOC115269303 [Aedes albopictus]